MRIIVVVMVLALAACSPGGHPGRRTSSPGTTPSSGGGAPAPPPASLAPPVSPGSPSVSVPPPGGHTVTFAIRGTASRTSVTYTAPGGKKRHDVVSPPWSRTFTVNDGESIDINAHSGGGGTLTCTLTVDGDLVKSATSSGDSATVDCGDSLGF